MPSCKTGGHIIKTATPHPFLYVEDSSEQFFALFPHRYDYLYAQHTELGQAPQWQTERRHPLSDRILQQGAYLYGVRFGSTTSYCLLDIDRGSVYHPANDPLAIARLLDTLEAIDLTEPLICTSSYSGGLHLYFPLAQSVSSWTLAIALSTVLSHAGFEIRSGQLELFPNPKPYNPTSPSLFHGHRLPLQSGSYLLNREFEPIYTERSHFVRQWHLAQQHNAPSSQQLDHVLRQSLRRRYQVSNKAAKFLNDLNAEIELGWTGYGQTNRLLGRIALRTYVFHHVLMGSDPLEGQALVDEIVAVARSLPGYCDWCRHQHEIEQRAAEWARCVEQSHYFRYGGSKLSTVSSVPAQSSIYGNTWNQKQAKSTRDRISQIVRQLQTMSQWPRQITQRFQLLIRQGIGGGSLYRHKDLWHPNYQADDPDTFGINQSIGQPSISEVAQTFPFHTSHQMSHFPGLQHPETSSTANDLDGQIDLKSSDPSRKIMNRAAHYTNAPSGLECQPDGARSTSLLPGIGGNLSTGKRLSDRNLPLDCIQGGNLDIGVVEKGRTEEKILEANGASSLIPTQLSQDLGNTAPTQTVRYVNQVLSQVKQQANKMREAILSLAQRDRHQQYQRYQQDQCVRMQEFLESGDPILIAEAEAWFAVCPSPPCRDSSSKAMPDTNDLT
jgi:hypothetical protein